MNRKKTPTVNLKLFVTLDPFRSGQLRNMSNKHNGPGAIPTPNITQRRHYHIDTYARSAYINREKSSSLINPNNSCKD